MINRNNQKELQKFVREEQLLEVFPKGAVNSGRITYEFHCVLYNYFGHLCFLSKYGEERRNQIRDNYTIVIMGAGGPTGKSALCENLQRLRYKVVEISEMVNPLITYEHSDDNHYLIDEFKKTIVVVLNKRLR